MNTTPFWRPVTALALGGASLLGALSAHAAYNPPMASRFFPFVARA